MRALYVKDSAVIALSGEGPKFVDLGWDHSGVREAPNVNVWALDAVVRLGFVEGGLWDATLWCVVDLACHRQQVVADPVSNDVRNKAG